MPTPQKIVRTLLRWSTPLLVLAALGGTTMDGIFVAGRLWTEPRPTLLSNSPGGNYRALLYQRDADNHPTTQLILEHHWHGIHLGQFTALDSTPAAIVHLDWTSPTTLHITCTGCDPAATTLPTRDATANWGQLHLSYDLHEPPSQPVTKRHGFKKCPMSGFSDMG